MRRTLAKKPAKRDTKVQAAQQRTPSVMTLSNADLKKDALSEQERWERDMATLRKAAEFAVRRNQSAKAVRNGDRDTPIQHIVVESLQEPPSAVSSTSLRALYDVDPKRAAALFNVALREGSPEQRRQVGAELTASGVIDEAIKKVIEEKRENCYGEYSLVFLLAKAGEVRPLLPLIEKHQDIDLRLAIVKLLASSQRQEVLSAFRRLALRGSLTGSVQLALLEAINQITTEMAQSASSAA